MMLATTFPYFPVVFYLLGDADLGKRATGGAAIGYMQPSALEEACFRLCVGAPVPSAGGEAIPAWMSA
jgi:hypothetical protein